MNVKSPIIFVEMKLNSHCGKSNEIHTTTLMSEYFLIVRLLKQISTFRIWRQNNNHLLLCKYFWKEKTFWSDGYFSCSVGNVSKNTIKKYIQSQG